MFLKSTFGYEFKKFLIIEATTSMNSALARFLKLPGKTSIVASNFIKVVAEKSDSVTNTELFLNVV